jgi:hypothetical protein
MCVCVGEDKELTESWRECLAMTFFVCGKWCDVGATRLLPLSPVSSLFGNGR